MKPQKAVVALKAQKTPIAIAKKRRPSPEKFTIPDTKKLEKKPSKKPDRLEEFKKKVESEKKKLEQLERRRKNEHNKKKAEEKKKEKMEKAEDNKKKLCKESEKKFETTEEKKVEKCTEKIEDHSNDSGLTVNDNNKKKQQKLEEKAKTEKLSLESKKKNEKVEEKKKVGKGDEIQEDSQKCNNTGSDENSVIEDKTEISVASKKKGKEDKKKEGKTMKTECKENSKSPTTKEKKIAEGKKLLDKETAKKVAGTTTPATTTAPTVSPVKKESKARQQPQKKAAMKKTVLAKKSHSPLAKKFIEKKLKLVKIPQGNEDNNGVPEEEQNTADAATTTVAAAKSKKKNSIIPKATATAQEKKPKLAKQMKVKLPQKNVKINNALKKDKIKKITEKIVANNKKKIEAKENSEKPVNDDGKKTTSKEEPLNNLEANQIKCEICDEKEEEKNREESLPVKSPDSKKAPKSAVKSKIVKKPVKKTTKATKGQSEESDHLSTKSEDVSLEDLMKQSSKNVEESAKIAAISKKEPAEGMIKIDLKVEDVNGDESSSGAMSGEASPTSASDSEDNYEDEIESRGRGKQKNVDRRGGKERESSPSDERARRMRLFGFWSGPKRHRVASLNALAKVHCLYENEAGGVYLGGFCKPKPEKEKQLKKQAAVATAKDETKDEAPAKKPKETKKVADATKVEDNNKRNLRNVPGLRGKHWDMAESSSSSSSSSSDDDGEREKAATRAKKRNTTRRKKPEEVMDLKDMVVCKRMASLNASAILAASYSDEKNRLGSSASDSSSESEVEVIKKRKQGDSEIDNKRKTAGRQISGDPGEVKPSKKVVIVNQDTDVTITGVYVNQTRSTHHEGFCSIAGMQYRISSTSHTQTAATAVAAELHEQQKPEQPCKSYTPLGALSSMQPPGSQGNHPNMSPRRHSAFSAPHQHGYYQPAGPLIQHPPTLPPVKAPPPEPTPTPPQNSEGSDDLVATSTTSGGTNSTGNSWRSFRKSESVTNAAGSVRPSTSIIPSGGGFYRAYCPQYYGTPPQYQELCYPPTYSHPHSHPPYYKYAPTYRRQYYGYPGADGGGGTGGAGAGTPGVVEYQAPPPGEYPMPPYYGGYPPPPPPPPPPPNPAYLHAQGRPIVDHAAFQGCPCPMQSCPKNVDTGPLIGNGKGAPVASGPGLSLPPSALVGPPSPARGLAGLAPPHGANAWDTDRVQLNTHRSNLNSQDQQQIPPESAGHSIVVGAHSRAQNTECRTKDENTCTENKLGKCNCQKRACTSTCEVKLEALSPTETLSSSTSCQNEKTIHDFKLENNNVKCESCSVGVVVGQENISCSANCNVKCESGYKCEIMKCEQCMKEGQMAILELDKDSGILLIGEKRLEADSGVKEELNDVVVVDTQNWQKPDYEPIVQEVVDETEIVVSDDTPSNVVEELPKCQKLTKRKLSLDSLSDSFKKRKVDKRTLSVGSTRDFPEEDRLSPEILLSIDTTDAAVVEGASKKPAKKESQCQKRKAEVDGSTCENTATKKAKNSKTPPSNGITNNGFKTTATDSSINETIDDVIQQSLQMSRKKERKCEIAERTADSKKKKGANLLSTIKKVTKKIDLVKAVVTEKLCLTKTEAKSIKEVTTNKCKVETKLKSNKTQQDAKCKSSKIKAKIAEVKSKVLDSNPKVPEVKTKEAPKKIESVGSVSSSSSSSSNNSSSVGISGCCTSTVPKSRIIEMCENVKRAALVKKKRKSTKKTSSCVKKAVANACSKPAENIDIVIENCSLVKRPFLKPKWSNGWSWAGDSYEAKVYLTNEESAIRRCYASMKHVSGDVLRPRDCVLLKSGQRKADLPFVAKIAALWENPDDGEMMFSLLWYYRPEHTEQGRTDYDTEDEVFASRHRDANSVACIEDKCYILTFNEYCRYRKNLRRVEEGLESPGLIVPPGEQSYPRECRQPPIPVPSDMVLFCRRVYDYRGKKLVKNPG